MPAPTVLQGLEFGFRTPVQTFRSWRTAVQGNLLAEEYRSLSKGFRQGMSLFDYSEARDALLEETPHLRWALYRAKEPEALAIAEKEGVAYLQSRIPGPLWFKDQWLFVRLVRQGYWDVWVEGEDPQGRMVPDIIASYNLQYDEKSQFLYGVAKLDPKDGKWPDDVQQFQVGWEWKIDDFKLLDEPLSAADVATGVGL